MREYHANILQKMNEGWEKQRESYPYYIFLRKNGQELKMALKTGNLVRGPYDAPPPPLQKK